MKGVLGTLSLLLLLSGAARADLGALLAQQKRGDAGAYVSSGFHDWRGVSRYRRVPGQHFGYDIAMLAGSEVRTPWPGEVVAITPWHGVEVGVTLRLPDGKEATFGHLRSRVEVGQRLVPGQVVGTVVVDHVDVKVWAAGAYFDFGVSALRYPGFELPGQGLARTAPLDLRPLQEAFEEYRQVARRLAEGTAQVRLGLKAPRQLEGDRQRLETLRPLATRYAQRIGQNLPSSEGGEVPAVGTSSRPTTDALLGLGERDS